MRTFDTERSVAPSAAILAAARSSSWRALSARAISYVPFGAILTFCYLVIAIGLTWPLAAHLNSAVTSPIDPVDSIWHIGWGQHQLLHHPLHLFNSNTFYPFKDSYLFDELVLGAAVLSLPLAILGSRRW